MKGNNKLVKVFSLIVSCLLISITICSASNVYIKDKGYGIVDIISTYRTQDMEVVCSLKFEGRPYEIYLNDTKLIIITKADTTYLNLDTKERITYEDYDKLIEEYNKSYSVHTEEMNIDFSRRYKKISEVATLVYDISDIKNPKLERRIVQDGDYLSSRMIENALYIVTSKYKDHVIHYPNESEVNISAIVPYVSDSLDNEGVYKMIDAKNICVLPDANFYSFNIVTGFNVKESNPVFIEACLGAGEKIYSSMNSLYIMNTAYENSSFLNIGENTKTNIIKYKLEDGTVKFVASGNVSGIILNQFSLDEYDNNLRIATTFEKSGVLQNNIYVLNPSLNLLGKMMGTMYLV